MHSTCLPCSMHQCFPNPSIPQSGNRDPQDACVLLLVSYHPGSFATFTELVLHCTALHPTIQLCTILYYTIQYSILHCTTLHYTTQQSTTVLYYTTQQGIILHSQKTIHNTALHYSTAQQCIAQHGTVLH